MAWLIAVLAGAAAALCAADAPPVKGPSPETLLEFDQYVRRVEARVDATAATPSRYLWANTVERRAALRRGEVRVTGAMARGEGMRPAAGGLIHDWAGAVFLKGAALGQVLSLVRDYDRHYRLYAPEVVQSRVLENDGDRYSVYLRLRKSKGTVVAVLDTEHDVVYQQVFADRWQSRSRITKVQQVQPRGADRGFLWRLQSHWMFTAADGGVYVECEAVSLTRGIPKVVSVIVPVVKDLPRDALSKTLKDTRKALAPPARRKKK